jgi:RNase P subunit RPR2
MKKTTCPRCRHGLSLDVERVVQLVDGTTQIRYRCFVCGTRIWDSEENTDVPNREQYILS